MKKLLREPLLHFLLLGAVIFAVYSLIPKSGGGDTGKIVVTQGQQASMLERFARTRQRAPTQQEWTGLIRDQVQDEVYYREALALGLDKDDLIIRRRLRQKLEFVSEGTAAPAQPSDAQLQAYLDAHAAEFATERSFSFRQVFLDPQRHGANLARDAERLLASLSRAGEKPDLSAIGDPLPLEHEIESAPTREVTTRFGASFVAALGSLPLRQWQGPVESAYGTHLVFVGERTEGGTPALDEVRDVVRREWISARQREAADRSYRALLRKYSVTIEAPPSAAASASDAAAAR